MLHIDAGVIGTYEFPGADVPVTMNGEIVMMPFVVTVTAAPGMPTTGAADGLGAGLAMGQMMAQSLGQSLNQGPASGGGAPAPDPMALLEKLGELYQKGILTEAEFTAKKAEILSKIS